MLQLQIVLQNCSVAFSVFSLWFVPILSFLASLLLLLFLSRLNDWCTEPVSCAPAPGTLCLSGSCGAPFKGFCRSTPRCCRSDSVDAWETPSILVLPVAEAEQRFMRVVKNTPIDSWSYISLSDLVRFAFCVQTSFGCCCVPLSWFQWGKFKGKVISIDLIQVVRGKTGDSSKEVLVPLSLWCCDALSCISTVYAEYMDALGLCYS